MGPIEFEQDRKIDPSQLDLEACRQADLFFKWAERLIEATHEMDRLKAKREVIEVSLQHQIRSEPQKFGVVKPTEASILAAVKAHEDSIEAHNLYLESKRHHGILDYAVRAMEMRKRMIEVLITLHGQKYFAGPSVPRDLVSAYNEIQGERNTALNLKQKARARKRRRENMDD